MVVVTDQGSSIIAVWLRAVSFNEGEISKVCVMSMFLVYLPDFG
jgi:hypothetical protein